MALSTVSDVKSVIGVDVSSTDETAVTNIFIKAESEYSGWRDRDRMWIREK